MPNVDQTPYVNPEAFKNLEKMPAPLPADESDTEMKPPKVIIPLTDVKLIEGQPIHLACKIEGVPRPKVNSSFIVFLICTNLFPLNSSHGLKITNHYQMPHVIPQTTI